MSEKHLPYIGGNFDRIVFEGDGSTWVREQSGTRYSELFGTPERAARTLAVGDKHADCGECIICEACYSSDMGCLVEEPDALLEWLNQEEDA